MNRNVRISATVAALVVAGVIGLSVSRVEAAARLSGDFDADIQAYDDNHVQILDPADALVDGIITALPARFSR